MCGIIAYIGHQRVELVLVAGLLRLEYRGALPWTAVARTLCCTLTRTALSPFAVSLAQGTTPPAWA